MDARFRIETQRLRIRRLRGDDAPFVLELVNEPAWLRFIGDRGVQDLDGARAYIAEGPAASYARHGFGLDKLDAWIFRFRHACAHPPDRTQPTRVRHNRVGAEFPANARHRNPYQTG